MTRTSNLDLSKLPETIQGNGVADYETINEQAEEHMLSIHPDSHAAPIYTLPVDVAGTLYLVRFQKARYRDAGFVRECWVRLR